MSQGIHVLVIDDSPGDRDLIAVHLEGVAAVGRVLHAASVSEGLELLGQQDVDVVLLDLGLPDSQGLAGLKAVRSVAPAVPVVVLTGREDDALGLEALGHGAQDFLVKGRMEPELLERALRYAVERHRLLGQLAAERAARLREREEQAERALSAQAGLTARLYGAGPLREVASEAFARLADAYGELLALSLESQIKRVDHDIPARLRGLAEKLGELAAGPRDVVEVHKEALHAIERQENPTKAQALAEEGRFLVLELMGHLVNYYRRGWVGRARRPRPSEPERSQEKA